MSLALLKLSIMVMNVILLDAHQDKIGILIHINANVTQLNAGMVNLA